MFSGLIRNIGVVKHFSGEKICIESNIKPQIGSSIAINGICTTTTKYTNNTFEAFLSKETRSIIAVENLKGKVHLEEALRLNDRLEGHIVQGHIDCIGVIECITKNENSFDVIISFDKSKAPLIVPKGSIAIDGVSLTINDVKDNTFRLTIIPHTFNETLFHTYQVKRRVNIETDILNRSIFHMLNKLDSKDSIQNTIDSILLNY